MLWKISVSLENWENLWETCCNNLPIFSSERRVMVIDVVWGTFFPSGNPEISAFSVMSVQSMRCSGTLKVRRPVWAPPSVDMPYISFWSCTMWFHRDGRQRVILDVLRNICPNSEDRNHWTWGKSSFPRAHPVQKFLAEDPCFPTVGKQARGTYTTLTWEI